ncbi:hypothetical protein NUW58_g8914 [Xylaria curta]|uniref:Uncharacterized protein n=1 Tax=Xylaria curta TaxID=42375 RepID=A0ACC1N360_9PEZI|nr:hypothetical protein NUW58_g8914 [Xylaria curta]
MGTTSAIVGAYCLAGEIGEQFGRGAAEVDSSNVAGAIAKAFAAYDARFRPFMDQVQKGVGEDGSFYSSSLLSSSFGVSLLHLIAGLASFFKLNIGAMMLKEQVKNWDLPDYEVLRA